MLLPVVWERGVKAIPKIKIGDIISFGMYPHDAKMGGVPIEWIELDIHGKKGLVISKQALDCQPYNTSYTNVTWETCSLRTWLNGAFLNNAFTAEEQALIQNTTVSADKNPQYSSNPGNATTDKVFLLSISEVEKYFTTDESRKCATTAYAKAQGAFTRDDYKTASGEATCWWWLRSPGAYQFRSATVLSDGSLDYYGHGVNGYTVAVRPALWINLDS